MTSTTTTDNGWRQDNIGNLCSLRKDPIEPSALGASRYVGLEHIDSGITRLRRWGVSDGIRSTKNRFFKGDILYGKLRPYLDKAVIADWEGVCSTDILTIAQTQTVFIQSSCVFSSTQQVSLAILQRRLQGLTFREHPGRASRPSRIPFHRLPNSAKSVGFFQNSS